MIQVPTIEEELAEVDENIEIIEGRQLRRRSKQIVQMFLHLCEERRPEEVVDLIEKAGVKGLEAVYA